jgi:hypothetical protein
MHARTNTFSVVLSKRDRPKTVLQHSHQVMRTPHAKTVVRSIDHARPGPRELARPGPRAGPLPITSHTDLHQTPQQHSFAMVCARVLIALLTLQPVYVARGMDIEVPTEVVIPLAETINQVSESAESTSEEVQNETDPTVVAEESLPSNGTVSESATAAADSVPEDSDVPTTTTQVQIETPETDTSEAVASTTLPQGDTSGGDGAGESPNIDSEDTPDGSLDEVSGTSTSATTTVPATDENVASEEPLVTEEGDVSATTTQVAPTTTPEQTEAVEPLVVTGGKYVFGEGDCTVVSEDEFYCFKPGSTPTAPSGKVSVIATLDRQGDREIYLVTGGTTQQITNNDVDDFAPMYDPTSGRIVWHSMVSDRLKVMMYDATLGIRQLSNGSGNASNPHVFGDRAVWQEWIGTNWEVVAAVNIDSDSMELRKLTDNATHDMFPQVYDSYVTWQRKTAGGWEVIVYEWQSENETAIEKVGDGRYENPRFMLLVDKRTPEGDIETVGYDVTAGTETPLGATPQERREPVTPVDETGDAAVSAPTKPERRDGDVADPVM